jgi:Zn-dependent alcohol dehydrogenase
MEFGATHTAASMEEALPLIQDASWGTMANKVIMTMGVGSGAGAGRGAGAHVQARPGGRHQHPPGDGDVGQRQPARPDLMEKQVVGSLFGSGNPRADIPKLLNLYREGQLDLDGLVTTEYTLDR